MRRPPSAEGECRWTWVVRPKPLHRETVVTLAIAVKGSVVSKVPPPLLGFNNNVRHRGRIFHIQTEDSGMKNPRLVTHLFADGGRIIKTTRTDYAEHVARPDMQAFVRGLMKEQHKNMFTALRLGELDTLLEDTCGPFEQALQVIRKAPASSGVMSAPPESLVTQRAPALEFETPPLASAFGEGARHSERPARPNTLSNPNLRKVTPSVSPPGSTSFEVDVTSLGRLPPRSSEAPSPSLPTSPPSLHSSPVLGKLRPNLPPDAPPAPSLSRPSSRFAAAVPSKSSSSIFGDGAISEQSLDEVILSYLAEDLDGSTE